MTLDELCQVLDRYVEAMDDRESETGNKQKLNAIKEKPKLYRREGYWWCVGQNMSGIGKSPFTAYKNWSLHYTKRRTYESNNAQRVNQTSEL